jgi:predicted Fe-Mo cluster-binding NifX family protein
MKAALTVWSGRVSPVFDVSREAVVLAIEDGSVAALSRESIETPNASLKVDRIVGLGIDVLVCGAISEDLRRELCDRNVTVYGFVAGEIEEIISALLAGTLSTRALSMPGCHRRRQRRRLRRNGEQR